MAEAGKIAVLETRAH